MALRAKLFACCVPPVRMWEIAMDRRSVSKYLVATAGAAALSPSLVLATPAVRPKARNIVMVHGLFADGSSWFEVIARLQAHGFNVTSVQNPLTTLPDAVADATRVLGRQDGPTVFVG